VKADGGSFIIVHIDQDVLFRRVRGALKEEEIL